jgi:hypothetical protein
MTDAKVHHQTRKAADISLAKRQISPASYRAVLAGEITLQAARDLGRDRVPDDTGQASGGHEEGRETPREGRTPRRCLCSCGETTKGGAFLPGHDAKLRSELVAQIRKGDILLRSDRITAEQRAFAVRHGLIAKETLPEEERDG